MKAQMLEKDDMGTEPPLATAGQEPSPHTEWLGQRKKRTGQSPETHLRGKSGIRDLGKMN